MIATVIALVKLHNFSIGESDIYDDMPQTLSTDTNYIMNSCNGHVELMHGGHHFDDVPRNILANFKYGLSQCQEMFLREALDNFIASEHWECPTLNTRK